MKGLLLLSSGIDSPVASRMMIDNGVEVIAIHFKLFDNKKESQNSKNSEKLETLSQTEDKVVELAKKAKVKELFFVDLRPCHEAFRKKGNARFTCVFCKRMMLRIAEKLAEKEKCDFLITGDNLGQVASQTLDNMAVINTAVKMKILAPLLSYDKNDTVKIAKKDGTYDISIRKSPSCPFLPRKPLTRANPDKLKIIEEYIGVNKLIDKSYKTIKKIF